MPVIIVRHLLSLGFVIAGLTLAHNGIQNARTNTGDWNDKDVFWSFFWAIILFVVALSGEH